MDRAVARPSDDGRAEERLVLAAQDGDREAYDALVRPRMTRMLRLAMSIVGNESDARDTVQEACLAAWIQLPRLRAPDRFEAWLWRIVINGCRTSLRSRRRMAIREVRVDDRPTGNELADPARQLGEELSAVDVVRRAIGRLDADRRALLILHHVEQRPVTAIAEILGIPEGTVKWRLHAARQSLERAIAEEER